ncbi:MAG: EAL domain-containing protein [Gemmatimonas sp.]
MRRLFTHAFQPIVNTLSGTTYAHEALIRGLNGESAYHVLSGCTNDSIDALDRDSGLRAIALAAQLGMSSCLSINARPRSVEGEAHAAALAHAALACGFPIHNLILEVTEDEAIADVAQFIDAVSSYRRIRVQIAIDDFGAGHSGLNLLADFQPDLLKLDMNLVRNIASRGPRQAIVRAILQVCEDLGIEVIAEGVETMSEYAWFSDHGVSLFQGYLFAVPGYEGLPAPVFPQLVSAA